MKDHISLKLVYNTKCITYYVEKDMALHCDRWINRFKIKLFSFQLDLYEVAISNETDNLINKALEAPLEFQNFLESTNTVLYNVSEWYMKWT
jgi:hypothetical protein